MIKQISSSSRYIEVGGGNSFMPYINSSSSNPFTGQLRYDGGTQGLQVFDGSAWITMSGGYATVNLSTEAVSLLDWARDKRAEELAWQSMSKDHPAVAEAMELFKKAEERIKIVTALCREEQV
jgi:hypothetical protein